MENESILTNVFLALSRFIKNVKKWAVSFYTPLQESTRIEVNTVRLSHLSNDVLRLEKF
jgi:hypothetical protein